MGLTIQRNRERKTKGQKVQVGRRWRVVSSRPAVGREALALAVSVRWHREEHDVRGVSVCTLKDACERHFAAKKLLATGVNPMAERKAGAEAKQQGAKAIHREVDSSFEKIARKWWAWWSIASDVVSDTRRPASQSNENEDARRVENSSSV